MDALPGVIQTGSNIVVTTLSAIYEKFKQLCGRIYQIAIHVFNQIKETCIQAKEWTRKALIRVLEGILYLLGNSTPAKIRRLEVESDVFKKVKADYEALLATSRPFAPIPGTSADVNSLILGLRGEIALANRKNAEESAKNSKLRTDLQCEKAKASNFELEVQRLQDTMKGLQKSNDALLKQKDAVNPLTKSGRV